MSQRAKARAFLRAEGHGRDADEATAKPGDKQALRHMHHLGRPQFAAPHQTHDGGMVDEDGSHAGLVRGI